MDEDDTATIGSAFEGSHWPGRQHGYEIAHEDSTDSRPRPHGTQGRQT
jgi:hypothetical protein